MRADNRGEGGILALVALILQRTHRDADRGRKAVIIVLGLIGAALLYGDGIITPAISVLGATEGLAIVNPVLGKFAIPLTLLIIFTLFFFQKKGTAKVGRIFGPVCLVWFITIGVLGAVEIFFEPRILLALNPWYALAFFWHHGFNHSSCSVRWCWPSRVPKRFTRTWATSASGPSDWRGLPWYFRAWC